MTTIKEEIRAEFDDVKMRDRYRRELSIEAEYMKLDIRMRIDALKAKAIREYGRKGAQPLLTALDRYYATIESFMR